MNLFIDQNEQIIIGNAVRILHPEATEDEIMDAVTQAVTLVQKISHEMGITIHDNQNYLYTDDFEEYQNFQSMPVDKTPDDLTGMQGFSMPSDLLTHENCHKAVALMFDSVLPAVCDKLPEPLQTAVQFTSSMLRQSANEFADQLCSDIEQQHTEDGDHSDKPMEKPEPSNWLQLFTSKNR